MTRLTSVTVEGFKGIDRIEFDPGRLNVVTGRNNSGKTSLLEALNLAYDPSSIARFESNLDTVINHGFDSSLIEVETGRESREILLETPEKKEMPEHLFEAFRQRLHWTWEALPDDIRSGEDVMGSIENELPEVITEVSNPNALEEATREMMLLSVAGTVYPYISYGPAISELYEGVFERIGDSVVEQRKSAEAAVLKQLAINNVSSDDKFLREEPSTLGTINFVDFMQHASTLEFSEDDADPVKVDNIGDYLREHDILEDLKTFDVDHLVFEPEDGEKYSVPFEFMGEGFKTIVGVLWELLGEEQEKDLVLLEEPETHMHPGYVRELVYFLVQLAREEDVQLFVTTHNNDFLNDFFEANFTEDEQTFLDEEFRLLQLQDGTADVMDYAEAEEDLKDLKLDLRGL